MYTGERDQTTTRCVQVGINKRYSKSCGDKFVEGLNELEMA